MTNHWIVIDLRRNHIAIGRLQEEENNIVWSKQGIQYWLESNDVDFEMDLCLYLSPGSKKWKITRLDYLRTLDERFKKIPSLFDEPIEWLEKNLEGILCKLGKPFLTEFTTLPILILSDRPDALPILQNVLNTLSGSRSEGMVYYVPSSSRNLDGFTLLNRGEKDLPRSGSLFAVRLNDGIHDEETLGYCWDGRSFIASQNLNILEKFTFIGTQAELERAGAAIFVLHWRTQMAEQRQQELLNLRKRVGEKKETLNQVVSLLGRLNLESDLQKGSPSP